MSVGYKFRHTIFDGSMLIVHLVLLRNDGMRWVVRFNTSLTYFALQKTCESVDVMQLGDDDLVTKELFSYSIFISIVYMSFCM